MSRVPSLSRVDEYVAHYAAIDPDREAFVFGETRISYREAARLVDRFARALMAAGVGRGERVAVLGRSRPESFISFLATASIGAIWTGLNPKYTLDELAHVVGDAQPSILFGLLDPMALDQEESLHALRSAGSSVTPVVTRSAAMPGPSTPFDGFLGEADQVSADQLASARREVEPMDPMAIVYTSGTTGRPKGALLSHWGLIRCSAIQADHWCKVPPRWTCDLPINHVGWLGDSCFSGLLAGGTQFFAEQFDPAESIRRIGAERLNTWGGVPTMLALGVETAEFAECDLSTLDRIIWGGAAAPAELLRRLAATGATLSTSYGMTETTGSVTYTDDDADMATLVTTVGRPDPRYQVRIAGADGRPVPGGEPGEIQVRGDHIFLGYLNDPDATREAIDPAGWLHTGDVGVMQRDGNIRLVGRIKEMYKSGGYNVYPSEIELAIETHPSILAAAVVGVPDVLYSEVGVAFVVPVPDAPIGRDELIAYCRRRLANYKVPKRLLFRSELPQLSIGKVDKSALQREAIEHLRSARPDEGP